MIITGLLNVVVALFSFILAPIPDIPAFPPEVSNLLNQIKDYIAMGMQIINAYVYGSVIVTMLTITIAVFVAYEIYVFAMWVIKKIPVLGIE